MDPHERLVHYLKEAYVAEAALASTLFAHVLASPPDLAHGLSTERVSTVIRRDGLRDHLSELGETGLDRPTMWLYAETFAGTSAVVTRLLLNLPRGLPGAQRALRGLRETAAGAVSLSHSYSYLLAAADAVDDRDTAEIASRGAKGIAALSETVDRWVEDYLSRPGTGLSRA